MVFMNWMTRNEDLITLTLACPFENTTNDQSLTDTKPPIFFLIDFQDGVWAVDVLRPMETLKGI